jgi:hypothetical protein
MHSGISGGFYGAGTTIVINLERFGITLSTEIYFVAPQSNIPLCLEQFFDPVETG